LLALQNQGLPLARATKLFLHAQRRFALPPSAGLLQASDAEVAWLRQRSQRVWSPLSEAHAAELGMVAPLKAPTSTTTLRFSRHARAVAPLNFGNVFERALRLPCLGVTVRGLSQCHIVCAGLDDVASMEGVLGSSIGAVHTLGISYADGWF